MLWLYRLLFLPGLVLVLPGYMRRLLRRGGFSANLGGRFGRVEELPPKRAGVKRVWLQAVSVGELLAIAPILEALRADGAFEVYLTTTTTTGFALARERFREQVIGIGYFPLDFWWWSARAWQHIEPDLALLAEGERWPEHLNQARARGVPVVCVNARVSDRSYRRLLRVRWLVRPLWNGLTRILACSPTDAERFRQLGFASGQVEYTGSIKLDLEIAPLPEEEKQRMRRELGLPAVGLLVLGASTWPGEEAVLIETLRRSRAAGVASSLLLVPRHAERRAEIVELLEPSEFRWHLRSRGDPAGVMDIVVADTTGELRRLTQLADVVFVGRSLPPHHEGQTPVEAAALARPILLGPRMTNFRDIAASLVAAGAARTVSTPDELAAATIELLQDSEQRARMSQAARAWHAAGKGAVRRTMEAIREVAHSAAAKATGPAARAARG